MEGGDNQSKSMPIPTTGNKKNEIKTLSEVVSLKVAPQGVDNRVLGGKNILQDKSVTSQDNESVLEKKDSYEVRTMQHDIDEAKGKKLKSVNIEREAPESLAKRGVFTKGGAISTFENSKLTRQDVEEGVIGKADESIKRKKAKTSFFAAIKNFLFRRKMEQENKPKKTGLIVVLTLLVFIGGAGYYLYTSGTFSSLGDILKDIFQGGTQPPTPTSTLPVATTTIPPIPLSTTSPTITLPIGSTTTLDFIKSESFFNPDEEEIVYIDKLDDLYTGIQESYYKDLGSGKFKRVIVAAKNDFSNLSSGLNLGQIWKNVKALALGGDKYSELVSAEVIDNLGLAMPADVYKNISEKYNIFFYGQPDDNSSRVVLVFKLNSLEGAEQGMLSWESTILYDLKNIFLGKEHGNPSTETFQDNYYKNTHIRYLNLPEPNLTMDYTVFVERGYLVLTTSREAAWATVDKLLGTETSSDVENNLDISTWKTYQSPELGLEFKYPKNWGTASESKGYDPMGKENGGPEFFGIGFGQQNLASSSDSISIEFKSNNSETAIYVYEGFPDLLQYAGQSLDDACQKNAYLSSGEGGYYKAKVYDIRMKECKLGNLLNGMKIVVFKGDFAVALDYETGKEITLDKREYIPLEGAILQTKSTKWPGMTIHFQGNTNFIELENIFNKMIESLSYTK